MVRALAYRVRRKDGRLGDFAAAHTNHLVITIAGGKIVPPVSVCPTNESVYHLLTPFLISVNLELTPDESRPDTSLVENTYGFLKQVPFKLSFDCPTLCFCPAHDRAIH